MLFKKRGFLIIGFIFVNEVAFGWVPLSSNDFNASIVGAQAYSQNIGYLNGNVNEVHNMLVSSNGEPIYVTKSELPDLNNYITNVSLSSKLKGYVKLDSLNGRDNKVSDLSAELDKLKAKVSMLGGNHFSIRLTNTQLPNTGSGFLFTKLSSKSDFVKYQKLAYIGFQSDDISFVEGNKPGIKIAYNQRTAGRYKCEAYLLGKIDMGTVSSSNFTEAEWQNASSLIPKFLEFYTFAWGEVENKDIDSHVIGMFGNISQRSVMYFDLTQDTVVGVYSIPQRIGAGSDIFAEFTCDQVS